MEETEEGGGLRVYVAKKRIANVQIITFYPLSMDFIAAYCM